MREKIEAVIMEVMGTPNPHLAKRIEEVVSKHIEETLIVPMLLWCPLCRARHIDEGEFATKSHATHSCQKCGLTWKPSKVPTVGVQFLPGYKNAT